MAIWARPSGSRDKQQIEFVPLDHRLQLPASVFSYVLQDWDQSLCVAQAFGQASATMWRMLELKQSVDSWAPGLRPASCLRAGLCG
jgi:hypothetical protein